MLRVRKGLAATAVAALGAVGVASLVGASPGDPDTTFGTNGGVITDVGVGYDRAEGVAVQSDGKIVVAGETKWNDADGDFPRMTLIRYDAVGALDLTFGLGGVVTTSAIATKTSYAQAIVLQPDGKIVVAGEGTNAAGTNSDVIVARFNTDGSLDASFGTGGITTTAIGPGNDYGRSVALQGDGKIVVGGWGHDGSSFVGRVLRYDSNGTLDTGFGSGGIATLPTSKDGNNGMRAGVALQSDGKIVWAGRDTVGGYGQFAVVRLDATGTLDSGFGTSGLTTTDISSGHDYANNVVIQGDGSIVLGGFAHGASKDKAIVRYDTNGALDTGFGTGGIATAAVQGRADAHHSGLTLQSDGKIVWAGNTPGAGNPQFAVMRYDTSGVLDATFGTGGLATMQVGGFDVGQGVAVAPDGDIIVVGHAGANFRDFNVAIARFEGVSTVVTTTTTTPTATTPTTPPPPPPATVTVTTAPSTTTTVTTQPVATMPATAPPATVAPDSGDDVSPDMVNASNQSALTRVPGSATALVDGIEVTVEVTSLADLPAARTIPALRSAEQVADLQQAADSLVLELDAAAGADSGLRVVRTETGAMLDGVFEATSVPVEDVIVVESPEATALFAATASDGTVVEIETNAVLELDDDSRVAVIGFGLIPGEQVELVVMSDPTLLQTFTVGTDGTIRDEVSLPDDLESGDHTLVVASSGVQTSLGLTVTPRQAPSPALNLPATGTQNGVLVPLMMLTLGLAALVVGRRRLI